jgi:hypothetical protein
MPQGLQRPDVKNEQYTPPVGGYGRDGPPQILTTKCFSISIKWLYTFKIVSLTNFKSKIGKLEKTIFYPNPQSPQTTPTQRHLA